MIQIPDNSTILAPAHLHLPLYKEILKQKKDCLGIQVLTLSSWLSSFYHGQKKSNIEILYQYKETLKNISTNNSFYSSKDDADFLNACFNFIQIAKTYQMDTFPSHTQKEKDLHEILSILYPIDILEDQTSAVIDSLPSLENLYILKKEYSQMDMYWIEILLLHGAKWLGENSLEETHYYSVANTRKQMEVIAKAIIDQNYDADDIFIALNNPKDETVLTQILSAHNIPFTPLQEIHATTIYDEWIAYLKWTQNKELKNFFTLLQTLYPNEKQVLQYYTIFPQRFFKFVPFLNSIEYQDNEIINIHQFERYKELELNTLSWIEEHAFLFHDLNFQEMAHTIQEKHSQIQKEDIQAFDAVMTLIQDCHTYIQDEQDLSILIQQIQNLTSNQKTSTIQGVLIGSRQDYCALRPIVFLTSTNASFFPSLNLYTGIFDEAYVQNTDLPNLESRIQFQQNQIFDCLSLTKTLYVLYPQSDYQGKKYEPSIEMENWLAKKPTFITTPDSFIWKTPNMDLNTELAKTIFFENNHFKGSISRLEAYARCPFMHALKYGLYLQEKEDITDIRIRGSILHHVLEVISKEHKEYTSLSPEEIKEYVKNEFIFSKQVLVEQASWFDAQIEEITQKLLLIFEQLQEFENSWHMHIDKQEHRFSYSYPWKNYTIDLYGYIDRIDTSNTSFCIFDYKSSDKDIKIEEFESGLSLQLATYTLAYEKESKKIPVGCFYIALKTTPTSFTYGKLNYRKKVPELFINDEIEQYNIFKRDRRLNGWHFSDASIYCDDTKQFLPKKRKNPSLETIKEEWQQILDSLLEDIESGQAMPYHTKEACMYCAYQSICRNAAKEIEPKIRVEKEDE